MRVSAHDLCAEIQRFREFGEEPTALVTATPGGAKSGLPSSHKDTPKKESPPEAATSSFNPWSGPPIAPDASWQAAPWSGPPVMPDAPWQAFAEEEAMKDEKDRKEHKSSLAPVSAHGVKAAADEADKQEVCKPSEETEKRHVPEDLKPQPGNHGIAIPNDAVTATSDEESRRQGVTAERQMEDARHVRQEDTSREMQRPRTEAVAPPAGGLQAAAKAAPEKPTPPAKRTEDPVVGAPKASASSIAKVKEKRRSGFPCLCGRIRTRD